MEGFATLDPRGATGRFTTGRPPILVLGARAGPDGPSGVLRARVVRAAELHREGSGGELLCSGLPYETLWMRHLLEERIEDSRAITTLSARSTRENIAGARDLIGHGAQIILVTCEYHLPRALEEARRQRLWPIGRPARSGANARPPAYRRAREALATVAYRLSGGLPSDGRAR